MPFVHKYQRSEYQKARIARMFTEKKCRRCAQPNPLWPDILCSGCRTKQRKEISEHSRKLRYAVREEAFDHYGHVCKCCGEDRKVFLCFDHINNDGHLLYNDITNPYRGNLCRALKKAGWPSTIQVLCWNCNFAKRLGPCPHQAASVEVHG